MVGASYLAYNTANSIFGVVKLLTPISITMLNLYLVDKAIETNNPSLLDMALLFDSYIGRIPLIGSKLKVNINGDQLIDAITKDHFEIASVLIERGANLEAGNPIKVAMKKDSKEADLLIAKIINKGVNLNHQDQGDKQNIFHDLLQGGKKLLIEAALSIAKKNAVLLESVDANGNNLAHLSAISASLRDVVNDMNLQFTAKALKSTNKNAKYPLDVIIYSYKHKTASHNDVRKMIDRGATSSNKDLFKMVLDDEILLKNGVPQALVNADSGAINFQLTDGTGSLPIDHALIKVFSPIDTYSDINLDAETDNMLDKLALSVSVSTPEIMLAKQTFGLCIFDQKT